MVDVEMCEDADLDVLGTDTKRGQRRRKQTFGIRKKRTSWRADARID
jgi:hypothetical protein